MEGGFCGWTHDTVVDDSSMGFCMFRRERRLTELNIDVVFIHLIFVYARVYP